MRGMRLGLFLVAATLGLALPSAGAGQTGERAAAETVRSCAREVPVGSARLAYVALARKPTVAFRAPGRRPFVRFAPRNANGLRTVFSIRRVVRDQRCLPAWYRVQLPIRPNGVVGYVRAGTVDVGAVRTRIMVDLSARRLTLFRGGRRVLRVRVSIGSPATPTPTGRFYVNQRVKAADPTGPYGPAALGVSAFSPVLTGWAQGGPIAVHGTNHPELIGQAVSTGCVRVRNAVIHRLFPAVPAGTPVRIRS